MKTIVIAFLTACIVGPVGILANAADPIPRDPRRDSDTGESLRLGTFNIQQRGSLADGIEGSCCTFVKNRVLKLAERVVASGYDVIAFQEAFDESVQDELAERLRLNFPYFVSYIDDDARPSLSSSGLMLFSRFPFAELPDRTYLASDCRATANEEDWEDVAFVVYKQTRGSDSLANKGAALVRIQNPYSHRIYNIVFTHLQAGSNSKVRSAQLSRIGDLVRTTVPNIAHEDVFVMGDFNINGDHLSDREEWTDRLREPRFSSYEIPFRGAPHPRGAGVFWDMWNYRTHSNRVRSADRDPGWTNNAAAPGKPHPSRIDYIFHNEQVDAAQRAMQIPVLEFQHMTIAHNLFYPGSDQLGQGTGETLSDHFGVNADINVLTPHCSSFLARPVLSFDAATSTARFDDRDTGLAVPGAMHWLRVHEPGTYTVGLRSDVAGGNNLRWDVYASTEMSRPIPRALGNDIHFSDGRGDQYAAPRVHVPPRLAPFYIRVQHPNRTWTGRFRIAVHRLEGTSRDTAIDLYPGQPQTPVPPPPRAIATDGSWTRWFRIDTDQAYSGEAQTLEVDVERPEQYSLEVRDANGRDVLIPPTTPARLTRTEASDNRATRFLLVRPLPGVTRQPTIKWKSNLKVLMLLALECTEQTDWGAGTEDDDIAFQLNLDGDRYELAEPPLRRPESSGRYVWAEARRPRLGNFTSGDSEGTAVTFPDDAPYYPLGFLNHFQVELVEDDNPGHDWLFGFSPVDFTGDLASRIEEGVPFTVTLYEYDKDDDGNYRRDGDGKYHLHFRLRHGTHGMRFFSARNVGGEPLAEPRTR